MVVICEDIGIWQLSLSVDKEYIVEKTGTKKQMLGMYQIRDNSGDLHWYNKERFKIKK